MAGEDRKGQSTAPVHVIISNPRHPHYRETGVLTGTITKLPFSGKELAEVELANCTHGIRACYVEKGDVQKAP